MEKWKFDPESTSKSIPVKKSNVLSFFFMGEKKSLIIISKLYTTKIVLNTLILLLKWKNAPEDRQNMLK